nr:hypothetical protein [Tanacetum cinerariifolium]
EAAKFVRDFKSLAKEADDSLAKHKAMELDNERLLKAVNALKMDYLRKVRRVHVDGGSSCEIIYESCFEKLNPTIKATKVHLKTPLVGLSGEHSWSVGRTVMQSMGIVVSTIHGAIKFHTKKGIRIVLSIDEANEGTKRAKRIRAPSKEMVLSSLNVKEKIIVNDKYPYQTVTIKKQLPDNFKKELQNLLMSNTYVFAWTHANMTGIPRTIIIKGKPFNTKHKLNEYNHIKSIKQNKRGLGPDRSMAACKK